MNILKALGSLFGIGKDRGIVQQANDVVERWKPSPVKEQEMDLQQTRTDEESQASARAYEPSRSPITGVFCLDLFNTLVDCANRLPRPMLILWAICLLFGWVDPPEHLSTLNPIVLNMIWTIFGFLFGVRTISQDIPKMLKSVMELKEKMRNRAVG